MLLQTCRVLYAAETNEILSWLQKTGVLSGVMVLCCCICGQKCVTRTTCAVFASKPVYL